jgi:hypothetical protein
MTWEGLNATATFLGQAFPNVIGSQCYALPQRVNIEFCNE